MDKSWMSLSIVDQRYRDGINNFIEFARQNAKGPTHPCPCRQCKGKGRWISLNQMHKHLIKHGMMHSYRTWIMHGEVNQLEGEHSEASTQMSKESTSICNPTIEFLDDTFPFRDYHSDIDFGQSDDAYEKYSKLLAAAQTPLHHGTDETVLESILKDMKLKVEGRWSDVNFEKHLKRCKELCPKENNYSGTYAEIKKVLKNLGLGHEVIHGCVNGCTLYYKENSELEYCPICEEPRYAYREGKSRVARKTIRYFPITPRLKRLYMSSHVAKEMRWHSERRVSDGDNDLRHPSDGEAWRNFDTLYPEFAREARNVRLGLATDGFTPFGITATSYSMWPIVVMPYNLPPSMCMRKEFNILAILVSGRYSPGKCLNVFMQPLIDELNMLWRVGVSTYDRHSQSSFTMKAAVLWTISDFPGLGMLGGVQTKGYKACPVCLNEIDSSRVDKRTVYQGHRRWLPRDHEWRRASEKFGGQVEMRERPPTLSGPEIWEQIRSHNYPVLSLSRRFKTKRKQVRPSWTHESFFYQLPYWKHLAQPYSLDMMHIEKNVFDNLVGAILRLDGKRHLWDLSSGSSSRTPAYTVSLENKVRILEMLKDVKYPSGYAGSLENKINVNDKRFIGLKSHDCHVMLERLIPVFIRPFLPTYVANPIVCLCRWFQRLCCRELKRSDVIQMKDDIVLILCHFERIFPRAFFTIMVHLMIHLPDQVLLKGPVHYTWMYPIERQLGHYKKHVRNKRFPEGCITEAYIVEESVTYINLYMDGKAREEPMLEENFISVVCPFIHPFGHLPKKLDEKQLKIAQWCVLDNCEEAQEFISIHKENFENKNPNSSDRRRIKHFIPYFHKWISSYRDSDDPIEKSLYSLSCEPITHYCYSRCEVNGVKFVIWERDDRLKTQNCGVMVENDEEVYYGILEDVIELLYPYGIKVVLFKCRWFNEDTRGIQRDHGFDSIDTSITWFEDNPYCLASNAKQVFYIDDPKRGGNWKVVNVIGQRGTYSVSSLARKDDISLARVEDAYQEDSVDHIPQIPIHTLQVDLGALPCVPPDFYLQMNDANEDSEDEFDDENEDEDDDYNSQSDDIEDAFGGEDDNDL